MVKIISDSTCDLSNDLIEKYNISIIPLHIVLNDKEYKDGLEITPNEIYTWCEKNHATPKTSATGILEVMDVLKEEIKKADEIIMFSVSAKMSATYKTFDMAVEELELMERVSVINSENLSTGVGHLVMEAAIMAKEGRSRREIVHEIEKMKGMIHASFVVDTLTYLHRGGRCSSISALAGGALKLHPKIVVKDGTMSSTKKYRGKMSSVIMHYVKDMETELLKAKPNRIFITHSGCEKSDIEEVYHYLENLNYFQEILVTRAGGVVSSHCGPGTLGVIFMEE